VTTDALKKASYLQFLNPDIPPDLLSNTFRFKRQGVPDARLMEISERRLNRRNSKSAKPSSSIEELEPEETSSANRQLKHGNSLTFQIRGSMTMIQACMEQAILMKINHSSTSPAALLARSNPCG
jgi:hypothetical protein